MALRTANANVQPPYALYMCKTFCTRSTHHGQRGQGMARHTAWPPTGWKFSMSMTIGAMATTRSSTPPTSHAVHPRFEAPDTRNFSTTWPCIKIRGQLRHGTALREALPGPHIELLNELGHSIHSAAHRLGHRHFDDVLRRRGGRLRDVLEPRKRNRGVLRIARDASATRRGCGGREEHNKATYLPRYGANAWGLRRTRRAGSEFAR